MRKCLPRSLSQKKDTDMRPKDKFFIIMALMLMASMPLAAQYDDNPNWISIAGKASIGNSALFCMQINDNGKITQNYFSPSFGGGGRLGVVFWDIIGVSAEYMASVYENKYMYAPQPQDNQTNSNIKLKTGDLLILARFTDRTGFYAEAGAKFTSVKGVTYQVDGLPDASLRENFSGNYTSMVLGLGVSPFMGNHIQVSLGLRGAYSSKNIVAHTPSLNGFGNETFTTLEMNPFSIQLVMDINYHFARFGSATCGKRNIIFFE